MIKPPTFHDPIIWPAIVKFAGDAELLYLASNSALTSELNLVILDENDWLIDSAGSVYQADKVLTQPAKPESIGQNLSAYEVSLLIQTHHANAGSCCVAKMLFTSVGEAIHSLAGG